jgi:hypothetical protein
MIMQHRSCILPPHALHGILTVPYHITIGVASPVHAILIRHNRQTKNGLTSWELYSQLLSNRQTSFQCILYITILGRL